MTKNSQPNLIDPFQLARDIASWLLGQDVERANKLIDYHERLHREAEKNRQSKENSEIC